MWFYFDTITKNIRKNEKKLRKLISYKRVYNMKISQSCGVHYIQGLSDLEQNITTLLGLSLQI